MAVGIDVDEHGLSWDIPPRIRDGTEFLHPPFFLINPTEDDYTRQKEDDERGDTLPGGPPKGRDQSVKYPEEKGKGNPPTRYQRRGNSGEP